MKIRYADRKRFRVGTAKIAKKVGIAAANVLKITLFDKSDGYRRNYSGLQMSDVRFMDYVH